MGRELVAGNLVPWSSCLAIGFVLRLTCIVIVVSYDCLAIVLPCFVIVKDKKVDKSMRLNTCSILDKTRGREKEVGRKTEAEQERERERKAQTEKYRERCTETELKRDRRDRKGERKRKMQKDRRREIQTMVCLIYVLSIPV